MTIPNDSVPDMSSHGFEFGSPLLDMKYHTGNYFYQYITKKKCKFVTPKLSTYARNPKLNRVCVYLCMQSPWNDDAGNRWRVGGMVAIVMSESN